MALRNRSTPERPDLPTALDEAQKRLQTAAIPGQINLEGQTMTDDPAVKRTKNPSYTVLVNTGSEDDFRLLRQGVEASSRKEAIKAVSGDSGKYLVIPDKEFRPIKRVSKQLTVDEFE